MYNKSSSYYKNKLLSSNFAGEPILTLLTFNKKKTEVIDFTKNSVNSVATVHLQVITKKLYIRWCFGNL